jgi:hypothetical protein
LRIRADDPVSRGEVAHCRAVRIAGENDEPCNENASIRGIIMHGAKRQKTRARQKRIKRYDTFFVFVTCSYSLGIQKTEKYNRRSK